MRALSLIVVLMSLMPNHLLAAGGEIYKWVDGEGRIHYTDRPPAQSNPTPVKVKINTYTSPEITTSLFNPSDGTSRNETVILYATSWCGYCKKARRYFKANHIPFIEYDVEKDEKGRRDYARLNGTGVPIILVGNKRMNGFSAQSFERIYDF